MKRGGKLQGDGKAKPGAAGFAIARSLNAIKRQQCRLQMLVRNTGAAIGYRDSDAVGVLFIDGYFDVLAEFEPVIVKLIMMRRKACGWVRIVTPRCPTRRRWLPASE